MDLRERTLEIAEWLKRTKTEWVATRPKITDLAIYLHFYRGDDLAVVLMCPLDRDRALYACRVACAGFAADTVALAFESYHANSGESPITGKQWVPGEMQFVFQTYPEAAEKGWVNECITVSVHERGGGFSLYSMPYLINDAQEVVWEEEVFSVSSDVEGEGGGGLMFEALQSAMQLPTLEEALAKQSGQDLLTKMINSTVRGEERLYHTDFATYRALKERGLVTGMILFAKEGSKRAQLVQDRVEHDPDLRGDLIFVEFLKEEADAPVDDH